MTNDFICDGCRADVGDELLTEWAHNGCLYCPACFDEKAHCTCVHCGDAYADSRHIVGGLCTGCREVEERAQDYAEWVDRCVDEGRVGR